MLEAIDPPDGGWGWMIILGVFLQGFFTWGLFGCYPLFFQPLMLQFDVGLGQVSWINGAYQGGRAIGYLFIPLLISRYGHRKPCVFLSTISALSISLASLTPSDIFVYILVGFIPGFTNGSLTVSSYVIIARYFKKRRIMALSMAQIGFTLGTLVLAPLVQILIEQYGLWGAILITGGLNLNCVVSSALYRPIRLHTDKEENQKSFSVSSYRVLKLYKTWIVVLISLTSYGGYRLYLGYIVSLALTRLNADPFTASLLLSIMAAVTTCMGIVVSVVGDHKKIKIMWVFCLSQLMSSFVCGAVWFINSYSWLVVDSVFFSITTVTIQLMFVPLVTTATGEEDLQSGLSWVGFICNVLVSGVVPATGLLIDSFNDVGAGFAVAAILFFLSFFLYFPVLRRKQ